MKRFILLLFFFAAAVVLADNILLKTVTVDGLHYARKGKGGMFIADLPTPLPEEARSGQWDAETLTLTYEMPQPDDEDGKPVDPVVQSVTWTQEQLDAALAARLQPKVIELSLRERLFSVTEGFSPQLRARFPFERVAYWINKGDHATAKAVIEAVDVSGQSQSVRDAKAALLAEFR